MYLEAVVSCRVSYCTIQPLCLSPHGTMGQPACFISVCENGISLATPLGALSVLTTCPEHRHLLQELQLYGERERGEGRRREVGGG